MVQSQWGGPVVGPILVAAKQYLESVAWGYTCNDDETVLTTEVRGDNATYTVNLVADHRAGWFGCYVIPKTTIPPSAVPIVAEYLARVNFANLIGDFEIDLSDGAFLYKTNVLSGVGDVPSQGAFASAINLAGNTMDRWYPGVLAIIHEGLSAQGAIARVKGQGNEHR